MVEPIITLTASSIISLAFSKFIESGTEEITKNLTQKTLSKIDELRKKISEKLQGNPSSKKSLDALEEGSVEYLEVVSKYLQEAMNADPQFSNQIKTLLEEINTGNKQELGSMTQNINSQSVGYQTKIEGGTAFIGGTHFHGDHP